MAIERKQIFDEVMAELDVPLGLIQGKNIKATPVPVQRLPDSINLSIQGQKALPVRKPARKTKRPGEDCPVMHDSQGNKIIISARGNILAECGADRVAWETKTK